MELRVLLMMAPFLPMILNKHQHLHLITAPLPQCRWIKVHSILGPVPETGNRRSKVAREETAQYLLNR